MTTRKERKPLAAMTPEELQAWLAHRRAAVESFSCDVVEPYLQRRKARRKRQGDRSGSEEGNRTDRQYTAWQREVEELAQGLQELRAMIEAQEGQSHQGQGDQPEPQSS